MSSVAWLVLFGLLVLVALSVALGWLMGRSVAWPGERGTMRPAAQPVEATSAAKRPPAPIQRAPSPAARPEAGSSLTPTVPSPKSPRASGDVAIVPEAGGRPFWLAGSRLDKQGLTLGRDPRLCDVVLKDDYVSSRHARIWRDEHGLHIEDLNSYNGIWHENRRITRTTIAYGELIRLGRVDFRLSRQATH